MIIQELPHDSMSSIAQFLPTSDNIALSTTCKAMNGWWQPFFFNNSEKVSRFAQNILQTFQNEIMETDATKADARGVNAMKALERFLNTPCTTSYSLTVDCLKYNDAVIKVLAKALPNLTQCQYLRPYHLRRHEPPFSIFDRVCTTLQMGCYVTVLAPLFLWCYLFESPNKNSHCTNIVSTIARSAIPTVHRFTVPHEDYRLNALFSAFSTITNLHITFSSEFEPHRDYGEHDSTLMLPRNAHLQRLSVHGGSKGVRSYCNLSNGVTSFVHFEELSSLSILDIDLINPYFDLTRAPIQNVIDARIPPQLQELALHTISIYDKFLSDSESGELLIALLTRCKHLFSLKITGYSRLFESTSKEPYFSLRMLEIKDQKAGGDTLFKLFPNLKEIKIRNWNKESSSIHLSPEWQPSGENSWIKST